MMPVIAIHVQQAIMFNNYNVLILVVIFIYLSISVALAKMAAKIAIQMNFNVMNVILHIIFITHNAIKYVLMDIMVKFRLQLLKISVMLAQEIVELVQILQLLA